jgi:hypothetical protein
MADRKQLNPIVFEDRRLLFRNFEGKADKFNNEGNRNFNLVLEPEEAAAMSADGWNVRTLTAKMEDEEDLYLLNVTVSYRVRPPRVVVITSKGKTTLTEDLLMILDMADFTNIDLIINPYSWEVNGKSGIKAYLGSLYATIREDALERKYADVKEIEEGVVQGEIVYEDEPLAITSGQTPY